ncbi:MAG: type II toxin-antitoxin system VapC family toxin [Terracidiphilus sp.]
MIIDTSALVAIITDEPDGAALGNLMASASGLRISAANYLEAALVLDRRDNPAAGAVLDDVILDLNITIEPVTAEQARIARQAWRDYGRGSGHPANLNFGDCFSYALARTTREPILFKGTDFAQTDLRSALK